MSEYLKKNSFEISMKNVDVWKEKDALHSKFFSLLAQNYRVSLSFSIKLISRSFRIEWVDGIFTLDKRFRLDVTSSYLTAVKFLLVTKGSI